MKISTDTKGNSTESTNQIPAEQALRELLESATDSVSTKTANAAQKHGELWLTISASALMCMVGLNSGWVGPSLESIANAQGIPLANAGSLVSVYFAGCVVTIIVGQWILDKFGGKKSLQLAAALMCIGLSMIASGAGFVITWLGSFVLGLGVGISSIAGNICILVIAAGHAASRLNRLHLFFGIGALIGPFIAWAGQQTPWSYHATYLFGVLYTAVVGAILIKAPDVAISVNSKTKDGATEKVSSTVRKNIESDSQNDSQPAQRHVLKEPLLWLYATILCLYVGIETGAGAWLFTFVEKEFQLSAAASAVAMSFLWGGLTLGRMFGVPLTRRFRPESITLVAMLISSAALVTLISSPDLSDMALLVVALLGFGFGPVFPTIIGGATTRFPQATGTVTTTLITLGFVGGIIGPWTIGAVFEKVGLEQGMELLLATSILMSVLYGICAFKSRDRQ